MDGSFGALLRQHRLAVGLTQEGLAERAGVSSQAVGALERGDRRFPHRRTIELLADGLALADDERVRFTAAARRPSTPVRKRPANGTPRQLPPGIAHFTGRAREVTTITSVLEQVTAVAVSGLAGMGGVGKTSLAIHVGHLLADHFPDGQVYLDLRGQSSPLPAREALGQIVRALGIPDDELPADIAEAAARYRSFLAGRQVLLVLDNAAGADQVLPLLPATPGSAAIVTSRHALHALPQLHHHLRLDVLPEAEAVQLLASLVGHERVEPEPEAAAAVVRHCGRLPLAIHIAGARLAARPAWTIADLAVRLADEQRRLDELERDDLGMRASFALTIDQLDEPDVAAFALLGLLDTPDVSVPVAARLFDRSERDAEQVLDRLAEAYLVQPASPGGYQMHDLLHTYARERAGEMLAEDVRRAVVDRVLRLLIAVAWRGTVLTNSMGTRESLADETWMSDAPQFGKASDAFDWLDRHRRLLIDITHAPAARPRLVVRLSLGLFRYYLARGFWLDWVRIARVALRAAQFSPDRLVNAIARMDLGLALADLAYSRSGEYDEALDHLTRSLAEFRVLDHPEGLAMCLINTADVHVATGDTAMGIACAEEALAVCEQHRLTHGEPFACENLGTLHRQQGNHERALTYLERSLRGFVALGNEAASARVLHGIGAVHHSAGHHDQAMSVLRRSIETCRRAGDQVGELAALTALGHVQLDLADIDAATSSLHRALTLAEKCGNRRKQVDIQHLLDAATGHVDNDPLM